MKKHGRVNSLKITEDFAQNLDILPAGWVFYTLSSEEGYLYAGISAHLAAKLNSIWQKSGEDRLLGEMWMAATSVEYTAMPDSMSALLLFKSFVMEHHPIYQHRIHPWADYVYLALDSHRFPFVGVQQHTNDDWLYIGPFRSRFFLADLLDSLSRILKLPYCETGTYPCDKFDRGICRGWCLALAPARETELEHDLDKLEILLKETFVHPNNGILEMVQKERDRYFDDLEFAKADLLDDEIRLLAKYRDWLNFLYVAKDLSLDTPQLSIEQGQLTKAVFRGREYHFPIDKPPYRDNEKLALPLASTDEMRIIYEYIKERAHA